MIKINKGEELEEFEFDLKGNLPRLMAEMGVVLRAIFLLWVKRYGEECAIAAYGKMINESVKKEPILDLALMVKLKELGYTDEN